MIRDLTLDSERTLYGSHGVEAVSCRFDGPADGESAFKESSDIVARDCYFNLRYPFWHDHGLKITGCDMTELCRAAIWYSDDVAISDSRLHGIKALRECTNVSITSCDIISPEFGWSVTGLDMSDSKAVSEYFLLRASDIVLENVNFKGKYSFQYVEKGKISNCRFDTKDAFWHAKDITVRDCAIDGEYIGWYSENLTFINCSIRGTQPFCYCKGLKLIDCRMEDCDLAFEKSDVEANILSELISIKNFKSGKIFVPGVGEIISDDPEAKGLIEIV